MRTYASKEAKQHFGAFIEDGQREIIQVTRNGRIIGGFVNKARLTRLIEFERKEAQAKIFETIKALAEEGVDKPVPTREELRDIMECDDDEIDNLFDDDFFKPQ